MKKYQTRSIIYAIQEDYEGIYKNASGFTSTPLFRQCMEIIGNISSLKKIVAENDKGIPPVQTVLELFAAHSCHVAEISDNESRCIGELMAFVFKRIFQYQSQKDNIPIENNFGVKTAALYYDREEFEISEDSYGR